MASSERAETARAPWSARRLFATLPAAVTPAPLVTTLLLPWVWLAFLAPGFVALRTWLRPARALVLALPATLVMLYACALGLQLLGLPIRGATVGAGLVALAVYPPRSAADFNAYFMADGMSPLVALGYWWCFVLTGSSAPWRALGFIQLEAAWVVIAVAALASRLRAGSWRAAVILAST